MRDWSSIHNPHMRESNSFVRRCQEFKFLQGRVVNPTPNHRPGGPGYLLVWVITFDLSGMGGPSSSYRTAVIALRIKLEIPSVGPS
jgi:hypothetical protein